MSIAMIPLIVSTSYYPEYPEYSILWNTLYIEDPR